MVANFKNKDTKFSAKKNQFAMYKLIPFMW